MTDDLRAKCEAILASHGIPVDRAGQLVEALQLIRTEDEMVESVPGRDGLRDALANIERATDLLEEAAVQAPQWPTVAKIAGRLREISGTKRKDLRDLGKRQDRSLRLQRQVARLGSFWVDCGRNPTRSVNPKGGEFGGSGAGGVFLRFLADTLELVGRSPTPDQLDHAVRLWQECSPK